MSELEGGAYPAGITGADHIAHDMRMGRFPQASSIETFLAEREAEKPAPMCSADLIAVILDEDARVENGRLDNVGYLAVKIATSIERALRERGDALAEAAIRKAEGGGV